jgi:predicted aspartyl protease
LKSRPDEKGFQTVGLVNTGFETDDPEILLPKKLAEKMGLFPLPPGLCFKSMKLWGVTFS